MTASSPDAAARDLYARLLEAWNQRDAGAYAGLFATDSALVGFDGSQVSGGDVFDHLRAIFSDHPTAAYVAKVRGVRALGSGGVILRAIVGMVPPGQRTLNPATNAVQTLIADQQGDDWRIALFQNTPAQYHGRPDLAEQHTAELQPLVNDGTTIA